MWYAHIRVLVPGPGTLLSFQLPVDAAQETTDAGSGTWVPAIHTADVDGVSGSWLPPSPALTIEGI